MSVRTVKARLRSADHLDAIHRLQWKISEVEVAVRDVVDRYSVDQDEHVVCFGPADANLREAATAGEGVHSDARRGAQRGGDRIDSAREQLAASKHGDGRAYLAEFGGRLVCVDDDLGQVAHLRESRKRRGR